MTYDFHLLKTLTMNKPRPQLLIVPGDGIGPEIMAQAVRVLEWFALRRGFDCDFREEVFGVANYHRTGRFMREGLMADFLEADAVLLGAIGGAEDHAAIPQDVRRKEGLLRVRREMGVYANIRPIKVFPALKNASTLKPEVIDGIDFLVVRELLGGIYFGEPRGIETLPDGQRRGFNTQVYTSSEIQRIGRVAFELARARSGRVTSVDKANVMEAGALWRAEIVKLHESEYRDVQLDHLYVDNASMQIVRAPRRFDVMVTDNLFGDILSDCASMIAGSLGMLPSASLSAPRADGRKRGLYEPAHGSAPDIAGQNKANPLATILSLGMALDMTFGRKADAELLERAVAGVLEKKIRTPDITEPGAQVVGTSGMGDAVLAELQQLHE
jgi:3-isopropylmalate dehydrogenase